MATIEEIRARIESQQAAGKTWREIAEDEQYGGVSMATLHRIANQLDYEPVDRKTRQKLGLTADRIRIAGDLDDEAQRMALKLLAEPFGGWSQFCRDLADAIIKIVAEDHRTLDNQELKIPPGRKTAFQKALAARLKEYKKIGDKEAAILCAMASADVSAMNEA